VFESALGPEIEKLARAFRFQLEGDIYETYLEQLQDLPITTVIKGCSEALKTMNRMPTIADLRKLAAPQSTMAVVNQDRIGKYCDKCYPDGYILVDHPTIKSNNPKMPYKVAKRCPCQAQSTTS
jgi:hypothetical protein